MRNLNQINGIEIALYDMAKKDLKLQEYFFSYYNQKLRLFNHFYSHIQEKLIGFNDHGPDHINRILEIYPRILENRIPNIDGKTDLFKKSLNFYEVYLLLSATIWHDVANLMGRDNHGINIKQMPVFNESVFVNDELKKYILQIAESHTGEGSIEKKINRETEYAYNHTLNLRFLAAILRLADELEETERRIDWNYYISNGYIEEEQKIYWEINHCIKSINPEPESEVIKINCRIDKNKCLDIFKKNNNSVALIDELIYRINKMNYERQYTQKYLYSKYLLFKCIEFDLIVSGESISYKFIFDDDHGYEDFWERYNQLNPEKQIKNYKLIGCK
ncbi:MAG: hypothetical protein ACFFG0_24655 [Candidatus Thorarchaeota archaeon]